MTEKHSFGVEPITCHAFNGDRTGLALSLNNNNANIYKKQGAKWVQTGELTEHGQRITSIDWAPKSNTVVTCAADRNAYVWTEKDGKWTPLLVILRINRAATFVKWSPLENKFAVGSGARVLSICYFEEDNNWWVSKHIKKPIRSTIMSVDWHPNNILIAAGSSDFKARVFSAYVKEVEAKPAATTWGAKMPFGNLMAEFSTGGGGWVQSVSFSASGEKLAWVGHDASIAVVNAETKDKIAVLKSKFLPLYSLTWITENSFVAVGYDCNPKVFEHQGDNVVFIHDLDIPKETDNSNMSAMNRFRNLDKRGTSDDNASTTLKTLHQNTITQVSVLTGTKARADKVATSSVDGSLIIWDLRSLERSMEGLKIN